MDVEPVSVGAFARFLSIVDPSEEVQQEWLVTDSVEPASRSLPVERDGEGYWKAVEGVPASWPMINVTWYGANAYSLWAHGADHMKYKSAEEGFLPTEAQWEYAARGPVPVNFPWGDDPAGTTMVNVRFEPWPDDMDLGELSLPEMPISEVSYQLGVSPYGLRHMAGNTWHWCRDTYDASFYETEEASAPDAWNSAPVEE
eukprot:69932-Amphidinium_carterae.1